MRGRALIVTFVVSAVVLPAGLAGAATDDAEPRRGGGSVTAELAGDRDHDRVSDDFEDRLRSAAPTEKLAVIVTGFDSRRGRRAVGAFRLKHELPLINGFAATMTAAQARALVNVSTLRRIEEDGTVHATDDATDVDFGAMAARETHGGLDGSGVGVCVIDTGIDPAHEQINPRTVVFKDFVNGRTAAYDDHGHGTHVASIAAGDGGGSSTYASMFVGVAPAANLWAAKVLNSSGSGADSDVAAAVEWCHREQGVRVLSLSLGSPATDGQDAVSLAVNNAVIGDEEFPPDVVVVAAGNDGDAPRTISAPGVASGAITVGAVSDYSAPAGTARRDNGIWLAGFSSRGPTPSGLVKPDIAAPGVTVAGADAGTGTGYVLMSGTSMATPYVSGAVALALDADSTATPAEIRSALAGTAVDVGVAGPDSEWGAGLIDVHAFVDTVAGWQVQPTAYPTLQHQELTVPDNGSVDIPIPVTAEGLELPLAVTLTVMSGEPIGTCDVWCQIFGGGGVNWSPDLDMELRSPSGTVLATSECAMSGLSCGVGRQETVGIRPTVAGTYVLRVFAFTGDPNYGKGGPISVDISRGPLGSVVVDPPEDPPPPPPPPPNQTPVVDAGSDQTVVLAKRAKSASFTLSGTATDADGTVRSMTWRDGATVLASGGGSSLSTTVNRKAGTYTFSLTATDDDGASGSDQVVVTVRR